MIGEKSLVSLAQTLKIVENLPTTLIKVTKKFPEWKQARVGMEP